MRYHVANKPVQENFKEKLGFFSQKTGRIPPRHITLGESYSFAFFQASGTIFQSHSVNIPIRCTIFGRKRTLPLKSRSP